jgi:hypothetical protein
MVRIFPGIGLHLRGIQEGLSLGEEMDEEEFFSSVKISNRGGEFCWEFINVYGHVQHEIKGQFL